MMSPRDALRSYRRAFRRAYRDGRRMGTDPTHPLMVEMGRRGDRLRRVYERVFGPLEQATARVHREWSEFREVLDAMTSRDLEALARDDDDACPF